MTDNTRIKQLIESLAMGMIDLPDNYEERIATSEEMQRFIEGLNEMSETEWSKYLERIEEETTLGGQNE